MAAQRKNVPILSNVRLACALVIPAVLTISVSRPRPIRPSYGHDPGGMRFSPLKQIDAGNVEICPSRAPGRTI